LDAATVAGIDWAAAVRILLHDRDSIFAQYLDESIVRLGVKVLKSPPQSPTANSICERVIGTIRRECLDWLIPLNESYLRSILKLWIAHYNTGRPHMALGPGVPDPPREMQHNGAPTSRHRLREDRVVRAHSILGGLHQEYFWAPAGAHRVFADDRDRACCTTPAMTSMMS
jgi:hypothetical protein